MLKRWASIGRIALLVASLIDPALAEEKPTAKAATTVFFTSFDQAERDKGFSYGIKRSLFGALDQSGFRFLSMTSAKLRDSDPLTGQRITRIAASRVMIGYEKQWGSLTASAYLGASVAIHQRVMISGQSTQPIDLGPVGMIDLWQNWHGGASRFSSLTLIGDQASRSFYLRVRHGYALPGTDLTIGPEASISHGASLTRSGIVVQNAWRTTRIGLHLGDIPLWRVRLGISGGLQQSIDKKTSGYGTLTASLRY